MGDRPKIPAELFPARVPRTHGLVSSPRAMGGLLGKVSDGTSFLTPKKDLCRRDVDDITSDQLSAFQDAFKAFDGNQSGDIDRDELRNVLMALGEDVGEQELDDMMSIADADGCGSIDFWEFATLMSHKMGTNSDRAPGAAFALLDTDGSGTIDMKEIRTLMRNVGEPISDDAIREFIRKVDLNNDGNIDSREFSQFLANEAAKPGSPMVGMRS